MDIDNPSNFVEYCFDENGNDAEDKCIMLNIKKIQVLLEIIMEIILYLMLHVLLIIYFKHH